MGISERLREARKKANLTQEDVENKTGINKKTISNWENGVSRPDVDSVAELCKLYKVRPNEIFEWDEEKEELTEYLDMLHKRPEMKMLFSVSKKATKDEVEKAVKFFELLRGNDSNDNV